MIINNSQKKMIILVFFAWVMIWPYPENRGEAQTRTTQTKQYKDTTPSPEIKATTDSLKDVYYSRIENRDSNLNGLIASKKKAVVVAEKEKKRADSMEIKLQRIQRENDLLRSLPPKIIVQPRKPMVTIIQPPIDSVVIPPIKKKKHR